MHALLVLFLAAHPACGARSGCKVVKVADAGTAEDGAALELAQVQAGETDELWVVARKGAKTLRTHLLATGSFDAEPFDPEAVAIEAGPNRLGLANATGGMCPAQSRTAYRLDPPAWVASSHTETGGCDVIRRAESWTAADPTLRGTRLDLAVMRSESCPDRRVARYLGIPLLEAGDDWRTATLGTGALSISAENAFAVEGAAPNASVRAALVSPAVLLAEPAGGDLEIWLGSLSADATRFRVGADGAATLVAGAPRSLPKIQKVPAGWAITLPEEVSPDATGLTVGVRTPEGTIASSEICKDAPATLGALGRQLPARVTDGKLEAIPEDAAFEPLVLKKARLAGHRWRTPAAKAPAKVPARDVTLTIAGEATIDRVEWETRAKVSELPPKPTEEDWGTDVLLALPPSSNCVPLLENLGWRQRLVVTGKARRVPLTNEVARARIEFDAATCSK